MAPAELGQTYQQLPHQKRSIVPENLRVVKHLAVRDWILASEAMFSSFSTTLLDAVLAQKPPYSLSPLPIPEWLTSDWNRMVPSISNREEFFDILQDSAHTSPPPELVAYTSHAFGINGTDPIEQIASLADRLLSESPEAPDPMPQASSGFLLRMRLRSLQEGSRAFLGRHGIAILGGGSRDFTNSGPTQKDVERMLQRIPLMDAGSEP